MATSGETQLVMKEYAWPIIGTIVSCIQLGDTTQNYELKNVHFTMLPSFYGIPNEDPLILIRFYATVQTFPLQGLTKDQLRMRCFPFILKDRAKDSLMIFPQNSLTLWEAVYNWFIGKFYSHQKTTKLRMKIAAQMEGEPFHEAWDRLNNY